MSICKTCHRWLTTIATLITGQCERCLLPESADPKLFEAYWNLVDPQESATAESHE